ncbi:MAG: HAD-IC family P-type ATPase, partial [Gammaproteobacteria bacterium]|nr:HAD-IC family P-type ATPase [Gammaproteobacteria bacterium]
LTLALALGVERMAGRKAIVRRLSAVEALGSVTVIATDKTGTLTENRMHVRAVDAPDAAHALTAMVLANDAEIGTRAGDPLELALLDHAEAQGVDTADLARMHPRTACVPFDSAWKFMRVTVTRDGRHTSYLKGAPEVLLARSTLSERERAQWEARALEHAGQGYRVIALASRDEAGDEQLSFLGLVLLWDPPRAEVPEAIRRAQDAGIRVVMITGDHPATAQAVAQVVGLPPGRVLTGAEIADMPDAVLAEVLCETTVFARVTPEHKLRVVEALKKSGEVVAVTGDGVNDAPALKRADVGVAMGQRGSDVSREVADLVLMDDNFATIVAAIEEGRGIYENIQKFIRFLFSTNVALVLLVVLGLGVSILLGLRDVTGALFLPLSAVQLLWINFIADGLPALALALDRNPDVMAQPPRNPCAPLLDRSSLRFIFITGVTKALGGVALFAILPLMGYGLAVTRTLVFLYESLAQLVFAYPSRRISATPLANPLLHAAIVFGVVLQILAITLPGLREMLGLEMIDWRATIAMSAAVLLSWGVAEVVGRAGAVRRTRR